MKKLPSKYSFLVIVLFLIIVSGCNKSDDEYEQIFSLSLKNNKSVIFQPVDCEGTLCLDKSNKLMGNTGDWHFTDLGEMNGIENIKNLSIGLNWNSSLKLEPGKGYIARNEGKNKYTFVRIFAESNIYDGDNVLGVNVKYQSPFSNKVSFINHWPKDKIVLNSNGDEKYISMHDDISFTVSSPDNWIQFRLSWFTIYFTATPNNSPSERKGTIKISSIGLEDVYIEVIQEGK